jgi:hypothetical protein
MADVYTLGLAKIEIGDIAADGGMGTTLAVWGQTLQGTCNVTQEDPETNEFYAEELDDPVVSISKRGKTTIAFSVMNPNVETLKKFFGGTVTGEDEEAKWHAPKSLPVIEKSVRITPQMGLIWEFPRMKINAKINGSFSRENIFVIEVSGTALQPTKTSEDIYNAYPIVSA